MTDEERELVRMLDAIAYDVKQLRVLVGRLAMIVVVGMAIIGIIAAR